MNGAERVTSSSHRSDSSSPPSLSSDVSEEGHEAGSPRSSERAVDLVAGESLHFSLSPFDEGEVFDAIEPPIHPDRPRVGRWDVLRALPRVSVLVVRQLVGLRKPIATVIGLVFLFGFAFVPMDPGNRDVSVTFGVALTMAMWWVLEVVPLPITALLPLIAFPFWGVLAGKVVAAQYTNSTVFTFLGGFFVALAMERWRLHERIALWIVVLVGPRPRLLLLGMMGCTFFLSMWISNTAATLTMVTNAIAVVTEIEVVAGPEATRSLAKAMFIGIAYSASIGGTATLIGTPPNLAFVSIMKIVFPDAPEISFGHWFLFAFPAALVHIFLVWLGFVLFFTFPRGYLSRKLLRKNRKKEAGFDIQAFKDRYKQLGRLSYEEGTILLALFVLALMWLFRADMNFGGFVLKGWTNLFPEKKYIDDGTVAILASSALFFFPARRKMMHRGKANGAQAAPVADSNGATDAEMISRGTASDSHEGTGIASDSDDVPDAPLNGTRRLSRAVELELVESEHLPDGSSVVAEGSDEPGESVPHETHEAREDWDSPRSSLDSGSAVPVGRPLRDSSASGNLEGASEVDSAAGMGERVLDDDESSTSNLVVRESDAGDVMSSEARDDADSVIGADPDGLDGQPTVLQDAAHDAQGELEYSFWRLDAFFRGDFDTRVLDWDTAKKVPWNLVLLFGGGYALAKAFIESGLSEWLAESLEGLESVSIFWIVLLTNILVKVVTEITSNTATAQVFLPILAAISVAVKVHPFALMIPTTLSCSFAFMLPVATPPNMIVFGSGRLHIMDMIYVGLFMNIFSVLWVVLLDFTLIPFVLGFSVTDFPDWAKETEPVVNGTALAW